MATRFCAVCGTEVDDDASFCPTCGSAMEPTDEPSADEIPAAPPWPQNAEPTPVTDATAEPTAVQAHGEPAADEPVAPTAAAASTPVEEIDPVPPAPPPAPRDAGTRPRTPAGGVSRRGAGQQLDLPLTWPVTLSGWLIGLGALVGALAILVDFRSFTNPVMLLVFLALLAVAATVFFAANMPSLPNLRLWVLVIVAAAFGVALDRIGNGTGFAGVVFFLGALAAMVGALIVELGRDRPMAGPFS